MHLRVSVFFLLLSEMCRRSLGEAFIYLLTVFLTAQQDLHADIFLFAAEGWNVLVCKF